MQGLDRGNTVFQGHGFDCRSYKRPGIFFAVLFVRVTELHSYLHNQKHVYLGHAFTGPSNMPR